MNKIHVPKLMLKITKLFLVFFQNEAIFVQLDELDKLDRGTQVWIGFNLNLTQAQKTMCSV